MYTQVILHAVLTRAIIVAASLAIGYFLGSSTRLPTAVVPEKEGGDDSVEEVSDGDLCAITPGFMEPCKMVRLFF